MEPLKKKINKYNSVHLLECASERSKLKFTMAQAGPVCSECKGKKTTNWKCVTRDVLMCESCNEKHVQMYQEHQSKHKSENANSNELLHEEIDETKFAQIRCTYHQDYYCTDICLRCMGLICAKCRYNRHANHKTELFVTFYQYKRTELSKCKNIIIYDLLPKAYEEARLVEYVEACHLEHLEIEKQKVFKQAEALKKRINERSHEIVERLEESFQVYKSKTRNKHKQKRMKQKLTKQVEIIESFEQIFMKNSPKQNSELNTAVCEIEQVLNNVENTTNQCDIATLIPRTIKKFHPKTIRDADIDTVLGFVVNCSILDDVSVRQVRSYDMKNADGSSSLAVSNDGTIWISDARGLVQISPNGKVNDPQAIKNICDISFMDYRGLLVDYTEQNSIDIQNNVGVLKTFLERPNGKLNALALHVCKDYRIIILTWSDYNFITERVFLDISELTNHGKLIKKIRCKGDSYRVPSFNYVFRISENINSHFCLSCEYDCKIVDIDNKGNQTWSYRECEKPYGLATSKLGNIVINDANQFIHILNSDGDFLVKLNTEEHGQTRFKSALSFKSDRELLILSADKLILLEFSTVI